MTGMTADEKYVRERWEGVVCVNHACLSGQWISADTCALSGFSDNEAQAWKTAREFTEQRAEEIRLVEQEIQVLHTLIKFTAEKYAVNRVIIARQAALAELRRGWKGGEK